MSSPDVSMPDSGLIEGLNTPTAPQPITSDSTQSSIPMPDSSDAAPGTQQAVDQSAPQQQQPSGPPKPSLWRSVLSGALQGLAAGSAVNTRGMSTGSAIAAGMGAGANQVLNVQPQQQAALDQAKAQVGFAHANTAHIMQTVSQMNQDEQNKYIDQAADHAQAGFDSGAYVPVSNEPFDNYGDAQKALHDEVLKNPWEIATIAPIRGADGDIQYSVVKSTKAPLQTDWVIQGGGADGKDITIPKGTPADAAVKVYLNNQSKKLETDQKTSLQNDKIAGQAALQTQKGQQAAAKVDHTLYEGADANGVPVAGTAAELDQAGIRAYAKMPALTQTQTLAARELTAPNGLFATAAQQIRALNQAGQLGPVASRWNNFWAGKGLNGDQQAFRDTLGLIATKLMQAHMGNKGGKDAMEHFSALVPENGTPDVLMKTLNTEYGYVNALAKRPKAVTNGN
jgi:hypothetical protein